MATNNAINLKSAGVVSYDGAGTFTGSAITQHNVLTAGASNAINSVAPGTNGNVLTSNGTDWTSAAPTGPSGLTFVSGNLTSSQIKNLHGTPIQIVAAPGAGKVLVTMFPFYTKFNYGGSNAFTAAASQTVSLYFGTTTDAGNGNTIMSNNLLTGTASVYKTFQFPSTTVSGSLASYENLALNAYNPVATEISGNAANNNTISYGFFYFTVTLT